MGEEKERKEIVLKTPEAIRENVLWEDGYPVGTIAHTEDMKHCWVWTGKAWEEC